MFRSASFATSALSSMERMQTLGPRRASSRGVASVQPASISRSMHVPVMLPNAPPDRIDPQLQDDVEARRSRIAVRHGRRAGLKAPRVGRRNVVIDVHVLRTCLREPARAGRNERLDELLAARTGIRCPRCRASTSASRRPRNPHPAPSHRCRARPPPESNRAARAHPWRERCARSRRHRASRRCDSTPAQSPRCASAHRWHARNARAGCTRSPPPARARCARRGAPAHARSARRWGTRSHSPPPCCADR